MLSILTFVYKKIDKIVFLYPNNYELFGGEVLK